ncbi:hypothetical protein B0F90DRAFT_1756498 [Multifurca ochricompacta]|uniref:NACHT domain-containing protein n=1 Tax=Multifurca ochricompacta TaxID=376703 RepID=A0AAD4QHK9_9AGAM|nr:hypothetical protein B0F90DRAFT_1756498 [Multifurca ochricompacta]
MRDERFTRWLNPTVNVLYAFSVTLGEGVGLVFSPAKTIFAGIGVLLLAARDVSASHDALIDLFERIESFFKRLETYTEVPPTMAMTEIIVKIMVEVLSILAIATKQIKQGRTKKYMKKLVGRTDVEDGLKRLDKLTQDEARMATTQLLKITHNVNEKVMGVSGQVKSVNDRVKGVDDKGVSNKVKDVDNKVKVIINGGKEAKVIMQQTANSIDNLKWNQMRDNIRKWLSHPDPSINHNIACDAHHKGTAEWFFQGSAFNEWKSTGSLLWVHGKRTSSPPVVIRPLMTSTIIQDIVTLRDAGLASLAYFYFDFRDADKQSRRNLLSSLLTQLSARSDPCCDILSQLYTAHDSGAQKPTDGALTQCLNKMLTLLDHDPIYIIVDALDECPNASGMPSPREQVLDLVKELVNLSLPSLHICVTSRPEIDIRDVLKPLTSCRMSLHDQGGQKRDILKYVRSVVHSDIKMQRWRDEDKNLVIGTLSERADGM